MKTGEKIRIARERVGLSQTQLGEKAGLSQKAISKLEVGGSDNSRQIVNIAEALNVKPEWLSFDVNPPQWFIESYPDECKEVLPGKKQWEQVYDDTPEEEHDLILKHAQDFKDFLDSRRSR